MLLLGDVLGFLTAILGISLSGWAVLVGFCALFPRRAEVAQRRVSDRPWFSIIIGLIVWLLVGTVAIAFIGAVPPLLKIFGFALLMLLIGLTSVGLAGLAQFIGARMRKMDLQMNEWQSTSKGATVIVLSTLLPLVGWFAIIPLLLSVGMGAGLSAVFHKFGAAAPTFQVEN